MPLALLLIIPIPPGGALVHGWHLAGAGPARFGWAIRCAAGSLRFLGGSAAKIAAKIESDKAADEAEHRYLAAQKERDMAKIRREWLRK
jgi:hypothetical protein